MQTHTHFIQAITAALAAALPTLTIATVPGFAAAAERIASATRQTACIWPSSREPAPGAPGTLGAARLRVTVALAAQGAISQAGKAASALDTLDTVKQIERAILATVPGARYLGTTNQPAPSGTADYWVTTLEKIG